MHIFGRNVRNRYLFFGDIFLSLVAVLASYVVRLELIAIFPTYQYSMLWMVAMAIIIKPLMYYLFGIYRHVWRYASIHELVLIFSAVTTASMILSAVMIGLRSKYVLWISALRFWSSIGCFRWGLSVVPGFSFASWRKQPVYQTTGLIPIRNGGKGSWWSAPVMRGDGCQEMLKNQQLAMMPIGFLDDDPSKQNSKFTAFRFWRRWTILTRF